jgi:hypothetical protein
MKLNGYLLPAINTEGNQTQHLDEEPEKAEPPHFQITLSHSVQYNTRCSSVKSCEQPKAHHRSLRAGKG